MAITLTPTAAKGKFPFEDCRTVAEVDAERLARPLRGMAATIAWCPVELRDDYLFLRRSKLKVAAVAREVIESHMNRGAV